MGWKLWKRKGNKAVKAEKNLIINDDKTDNLVCKSTEKRSKGQYRDLIKQNKDLIISYGETVIDQFTKFELVKQLPLFQSFIALYESAMYLHQRSYIKRLKAFLEHFDGHLANEEEKEKYKQKILANKPKREKEIKYILEIIEQYTSEEKARMLSSLYLAYLDEVIKWSQFIKYSETIHQLLPFDYDLILNRLALLHKTDEEKWQHIIDLDHGNANDINSRWNGLGLLEMDPIRYNTVTVYGRDGAPHEVISPYSSSDSKRNTYHETQYGDLFFRIIKKYDLMKYPDE